VWSGSPLADPPYRRDRPGRTDAPGVHRALDGQEWIDRTRSLESWSGSCQALQYQYTAYLSGNFKRYFHLSALYRVIKHFSYPRIIIKLPPPASRLGKFELPESDLDLHAPTSTCTAAAHSLLSKMLMRASLTKPATAARVFSALAGACALLLCERP
jgi:hypothetical protein